MSEPEDIPAALRAAACRGDDARILALLAEGADVNVPTSNGWTALMNAMRQKSASTVKLLLENGADIYARNIYGQDAMDHSLAGGYLSLLIEHAARTGCSYSKERLSSLLSKWVGSGKPGVIKTLLDAGADANAQNDWPPLQSAVSNYGSRWNEPEYLSRQEEVIRFLLEHGADIDYTYQRLTSSNTLMQQTALDVALSMPKPAIFYFLRRHGAKITTSIIHHTVRYHSVFGLPRLYAEGADIHVRDASGCTTLMTAAQAVCTFSVQFLLERGADVNATSPDGKTALDYLLSVPEPSVPHPPRDEARKQIADMLYAAQTGHRGPGRE